MGTDRHTALDLLDRTFRSKPLVFVVLAWMVGIGLADRWAVTPQFAGAAGLALGLAALAVRRRWPSLLLLLLGVPWLAVAATRLAMTPPSGDISHLNNREVAVGGTVDTPPANGCDHWRCLISCSSVTCAGKAHPAGGRLYLRAGKELSHLEPGDAVVVYGLLEAPSPARNPGGFSLACWLARRHVFATLSAKTGAVVAIDGGSWNWQRWPARLRQRIADANRRVMDDPGASALLNAMLFGEIDPEDTHAWDGVVERFRRAGVSHVLIVSGAQVALLFGLLSAWRGIALRARRQRGAPWSWLRVTGSYSPRRALAGGLTLLAIYVPLIGLQPSILRPALVVAIFSVGRLLDREVDAENSLAAAALLLLVVNPLMLYDLSFQLSFAAVWGIVRWTAPLTALLSPAWLRPGDAGLDEPGPMLPFGGRPAPASRIVKVTVSIAAMTLAAQAATAPLVARQFQTLSLIAPFSNPPIIGLAMILLPLGLFCSALNTLALGVAGSATLLLHPLNVPLVLLTRLLGAAVAAYAQPAAATIPVSPPSWSEVALIGGLLLAGSQPSVVRWRPLSLFLLALAAVVMAFAVFRPALSAGQPTLTFIDVGQGDGCLIRLPGGANLLVDGGGSPRAPCGRPDCSDAPVGRLADSIRRDCSDAGRDVLASFLRYERVRRIDLMVLTHPHDDHLWGLDALLDPRQRFDVRQVLETGRSLDTPASREWHALLRRRHLTPIAARRGMELSVGPARLVVLHPSDIFLSRAQKDPDSNSGVNNDSIVLRLEVGGSRVLLTGDAQSEAEAAMQDEDVQAPVLKVGHHGSAYSTSDAWLERVQPAIAVISCGRHNNFGHPSPATLERLQRHGVQVYRTDQDGAVTLELGRDGWSASTMVNAR